MKKKGAELPDNVLSIIIATIVILIFVVGVYKIIMVFSNQDTENAKNTIDTVQGKIDALKYGETGNFLIQGFKNGDNWAVFGWGEAIVDAPERCNYLSCICICPKDASAAMSSTSCQSKGFCRNLNTKAVSVQTLQSASSTNVLNPAIPGANTYEQTGEAPLSYITITNKVSEIKIYKDKDSITIQKDSTNA